MGKVLDPLAAQCSRDEFLHDPRESISPSCTTRGLCRPPAAAVPRAARPGEGKQHPRGVQGALTGVVSFPKKWMVSNLSSSSTLRQ